MSRTKPLDEELYGFAADAVSKIAAFNPKTWHALISCSKSKVEFATEAENMYTSPLFKKSLHLVNKFGIDFSILSAKYGLLRPSTRIEPYDTTLRGASTEMRSAWNATVCDQLDKFVGIDTSLMALAGDEYIQPLLRWSANNQTTVYTPLDKLSLGRRLAVLNYCIRIVDRKATIERAYKLLSEIANRDGLHPLRDILYQPLPRQGVYFFFDDTEGSIFSNSLPRLVRIGTHGVSAGSNATLRNRLRTHFGTRSGSGNHRASVFRLHVGRAIIERDKLQDRYPTWGKGQAAPRATVESEGPLESAVSSYIGALRVLYIPISDAPGSTSMRAVVEKQFIALFSEARRSLEAPSEHWLGHFSDKASIRQTGLWNVRDVGSACDLRFIELVESLARRPQSGSDQLT